MPAASAPQAPSAPTSVPAAPPANSSPSAGGVCVSATPEWAAWSLHLARHARMSRSAMLDAAAIGFAKATGFDEPPPQRLGERRSAAAN